VCNRPAVRAVFQAAHFFDLYLWTLVDVIYIYIYIICSDDSGESLSLFVLDGCFLSWFSSKCAFESSGKLRDKGWIGSVEGWMDDSQLIYPGGYSQNVRRLFFGSVVSQSSRRY